MTLSPSARTPANVTVKNPEQSLIARDLPYRIAVHHVFRSAQVLQANQSIQRFPRSGYRTYVGRGAMTAVSSPGSADQAPPNTRERSLESMSSEAYLRGGFHPFPGRIYFTSATGADFRESVVWILRQFARIAPRGKWGPPKKNHPYRYAQTLAVFIDGTRYDPSTAAQRLSNLSEGTGVEIINYAPHAAALEVDRYGGGLSDRFDTLYFVFREAQAMFAPGVQVGYDYVSSDTLGLSYGEGTGGPSRRTAEATGRGKSYVSFGGGIYALPRITVALNAAGLQNVKTSRPGRRARNINVRG